jgi:hypothetical protein
MLFTSKNHGTPDRPSPADVDPFLDASFHVARALGARTDFDPPARVSRVSRRRVRTHSFGAQRDDDSATTPPHEPKPPVHE